MKYLFYGLVAWMAVVFFRAFLKFGKRNPNRWKGKDSAFSSSVDISVVLPEGSILPNQLFPVLGQEQVLNGLHICIGESPILNRPRNIWHLKEKRTFVPSFSFMVTGKDVELSICAEAQHGIQLAQIFAQTIHMSHATVTLKCPMWLSIHASSVDFYTEMEIESCTLSTADTRLMLVIPALSLSLYIGLDLPVKTAIDKVLCFADTFHETVA